LFRLILHICSSSETPGQYQYNINTSKTRQTKLMHFKRAPVSIRAFEQFTAASRQHLTVTVRQQLCSLSFCSGSSVTFVAYKLQSKMSTVKRSLDKPHLYGMVWYG